ncbi:hypothetical protein [Bradyrhizobium sp. 930_D9_N1_4]|uniref:hypothetical protein n=1 Tax=Bradyrhizobium sp. 930_D9_N1_4 TaxID=3240374 RepID=UPI003F8ADA48
MPILTIEILLENPWTVLTHDLPEHPSKLLLLTGQIAATCLRAIAYERIDDLEEDGLPEIISEERGIALDEIFLANDKIGEIIYRLEDLYGVPCHDFWLSRTKPKRTSVFGSCKAFLLRRIG